MKSRAWLWAGLLILPGIADVQSPSAWSSLRAETQDSQEIRHDVSVTVKLVQVYVTDKDGNAVLDLTASDFVLYDNGRPQPISGFEVHRPAPRSAPGEVAHPPLTGASGLKLPRKFFLYFDAAGQNQMGWLKSKTAALQFIDTQLQAGDELAVLIFSDNRQLTMVHYLSTDHQKIRKVVEDLKPMTGRPEVIGLWFTELALENAERELQAETRSRAPEGRRPVGSGAQEDVEALILEHNFQSSVLSEKHGIAMVVFRELAKALALIPGYKNIIYFSDGMPNKIFLTRQDQYETMAKSLADANARVFAVNTSSDPADAYRGDLALNTLSKTTGGAYFAHVGQARLVADEIHRLTVEYYVLGYQITERWDGKFHRLKVEVKRPGCRVRAQEGFFNPKPFAELSETEKQIHLIDLALSDSPQFQTPLELQATAVPARRQGGSLGIFLAEVPLEEFRTEVGSTPELIALVINQDEAIVDSRKGEADLSRIGRKVFYPYIVSAVPPGTYDFRVVFRNPKTGRSARALSRVVIPQKPAGGFGLDDPLLLIPDTEAAFVNITAESEPGLSLKSLYPVMPGTCAPVCRDIPPSTSKLLAAVLLEENGTPRRDLTVDFFIRPDPEGDPTPLSGSLLKAHSLTGEIKALLFEVNIPPLQAGSYILDMICRDKVSREQRQGVRRLRFL